jgi:hypothetical protein
MWASLLTTVRASNICHFTKLLQKYGNDFVLNDSASGAICALIQFWSLQICIFVITSTYF